MTDLIVKRWCSFCQSKESTGTLTGRVPDLGPELVEMPACDQCVESLFPDMVGNQLPLF